MKHDDLLAEMVERLERALGADLVSVVLYGPAAQGDVHRAHGHLHLLIVLSDLDPGVLARLTGPVHWWLGKDQPWPRLFSRELIVDSLDVFPIEFLDIARHHRALRGAELLTDVHIDRRYLRLQCERELREKLMRLGEGYVECRGRHRALGRLLAESYASFVPIWRACLHVLGAPIPVHDREVVADLCQLLDLPRAPFEAVAQVARAERPAEPERLFASYYRAAGVVTRRIDRLTQSKGELP